MEIQFCYAWDKDDESNSRERFDKLENLKEIVESNSKNNISVYLDRISTSMNTKKEKEIEHLKDVDLICFFATPDAKDILEGKIADYKNRTLWQEWEYIKKVYTREERDDMVFPIILEGTYENALIEEFQEKIVPLFESFGIGDSADGKDKQSSNEKRELKKLCNQFAISAARNSIIKSKQYGDTLTALNELFYLDDTTKLPPTCVVDLQIAGMIMNQKYYYVSGRKGAGKSTFLTHFIKAVHRKNNYKQVLSINADAVYEQTVYEEVYKKHHDDLKEKTIDVFWQVFLLLHSIMVVCADFELKIAPEDNDSLLERYEFMKTFSNEVRQKIGISLDDLKDPIVLSEQISETTIDLINQTAISLTGDLQDNAVIISRYRNMFNCKRVLEVLMNSDDLKRFFNYLESCKKRIFFTFDGLDTMSQDLFLLNCDAEDGQYQKYLFDARYFRSLLQVVYRIKKAQIKSGYLKSLGKVSDFCIILPEDKYKEVSEIDADYSKKQIVRMTWNPSQLTELLSKRLELIVKLSDKRLKIKASDDVIERFNYLVNYLKIPTTITMQNGRQTTLLNYLLRNSIWRPRDVIRNLGGVMSAMGTVEKNKWKVRQISAETANATIKSAIQRTSLKILSEVFSELKIMYPNLEEVLKDIEVDNEVMPVQDFIEVLKNTKALRGEANTKIYKPEETLQIFWKVGIIGLKFDKNDIDVLRQYYSSDICFNFSDGQAPFEYYLGHLGKKDIKVVINPLFAKKMDIKNYSNEEIIGDWSDDYIRTTRVG